MSLKRIITSLFLVSAFGACFYGLYIISVRQNKLQTQLAQAPRFAEPAKKPEAMIPARDMTTWVNVQRTVKNTVVQVVCEVARFNWREPYKAPAQEMSGGSGFFINDQGDLVTNYHVVAQARKIDIRLPFLGQELFEAEIIGASPDRDIALLKLIDKDKTRLLKRLNGTIPYLELGDSDSVLTAQDIMALGYPLGQANLKSTIGNVSGRERLASQYYFQITAPLNPGNSGGPSVNADGDVIGVNSAGVIQAQNVGYIIPINDVKSALRDLYKVKLLRKPALGCLFTPTTKELVNYYGNPEEGGWYISRVFKNSILDKFGVKQGDMLYEVNNHKVDMFGDIYVSWSNDKVSLLDLLNRFVVGDDIHLVIYRSGKRKDIRFKLEPRFLLPVRKMYPDFETIDYEVIGGMCIMELALNHIPTLLEDNPALASIYAGYARPEKQYEKSLVITNIFPDSPARKTKVLYPGTLIDQVNSTQVITLAQFRKAVLESKKTGYLTISSKEEQRFAVMSLPDILEEEERLVSVYFFKKSPLIERLSS